MSQLSVTRSTTQSGFTLVMTLSILAAVTILVVGLFSIVARERKTSTSFDAVEQADLAVQAGLEQAGALLKEALRDENGIIMAVPTAPWITDVEVEQDTEGRLQRETGKEPRASLIAANFKPNGSSVTGGSWTYVPLVSGVATSEQQGQIPPDRELRDLKDVIRPAIPGVFVNGESNFKFDPVVPVQTPEELRELKHQVQNLTQFQPWLRTPSAYWVELTRPTTVDDAPEANGETVASRFCFYVEDLQGLVNLGTAGNVDPPASGEPPTWLHTRAEWRLPAAGQVLGIHAVPGLNLANPALPRLNQISLHTILQPNVEARMGSANLDPNLGRLNRHLISVRPLMFTPDSWKEAVLQANEAVMWAGLNEEVVKQRFTEQVGGGSKVGSLMDRSMRGLEENVVGGVLPYEELALLPHDNAISKMPGDLKLNLNRVLNELETVSGEARKAKANTLVSEVAAFIEKHAGQFGQTRMGGYPFPKPPIPKHLNPLNALEVATRVVPGATSSNETAYLRCLAAGILDYADTDSVPTMDGDPFGDPDDLDPKKKGKTYPTYRGMDAYPLVSEVWQEYKVISGDAAKKEPNKFLVTTYLELWNMTNVEIRGEVMAAYECNGTGVIGTGTPQVLNDVSKMKGERPTESMGTNNGLWHPKVALNPGLRPNEYRVLKFESVEFHFPSFGQSGNGNFKGQGIGLEGDFDMRSGYRLAFKPEGAAAFVLVDQPLRPVLRNAKSAPSTGNYTSSAPGMSYGNYSTNTYVGNVGDPRASFFINEIHDVVAYTASSPFARTERKNIRDEPYGQNRIFFWADGGHQNLLDARAPSTGMPPNNPSLKPARNAENDLAERRKFVQWISNRGRFSSVTELGHVYDPIMWDNNGGVETNVMQFRDLGEVTSRAEASTRYGGGSTLRIGRAEHERWLADYSAFPESGRLRTRAASASILLDLFHCGIADSAVLGERTGNLARIDGQININTATREALRAALAGRLVMDPQLKQRSQDKDPSAPLELQPPTSRLPVGKDDSASHADLAAELIIRHRPFVSVAEVVDKVVMPTAGELVQRPLPKGMTLEKIQGQVLAEKKPIFGMSARTAPAGVEPKIEPEWSDAAAEEAFARLFNSSTVRSRNFRVVVSGQAVRKTRSGKTVVLATRSRLYHIFIRPTNRDGAGNITSQKVEIIYARNL